MYPNTVVKFDVDRKGLFYLVTIKTSLNKKMEIVEEVILVKHMGEGDIVDYLGKYPIHERAIESLDFLKGLKPLTNFDIPADYPVPKDSK